LAGTSLKESERLTITICSRILDLAEKHLCYIMGKRNLTERSRFKMIKFNGNAKQHEVATN
jgi:hypothetical protein